LQARNTWNGVPGSPLTRSRALGGIGNPAASIADAGKTAYIVSYDPYGAEHVTAGGTSAQWQQNPYGYKNGLRSSNADTGLTKFGYRWQSSTTGAWIERDTLDAPLDPNNANRYAYAGLDPVNRFDSTGRCASIPGNGVCTGGSGAYDASEALPWAAYTCAAVDLYALAASAIPPLPVVAAPIAITCGVISVAGAIANPPWE